MSHAQPGELIENVVGRRIHEWERSRTAGHLPVITISRQYGARGAEVARALARHTGFDVWDREVVHCIAEQASMPLAVIVSLDEHRQAEIQELLSELGGASSDDYLRGLVQAVRTIAARGRAIIVGRGAHYALGPEHALRVRVVSSLERRIASISDRAGLAGPDALAHIQSTDEDRRAFTKYYFDRDDEDPADYDLVVNSGTLGIEGCADLIVATYRARFGDPASAVQYRK